jgi:hypothetical protein
MVHYTQDTFQITKYKILGSLHFTYWRLYIYFRIGGTTDSPSPSNSIHSMASESTEEFVTGRFTTFLQSTPTILQ